MARFEYVNNTIQELYVQTYAITDSAIKELRVLRQTTNPQVLVGGWTASATTLGFDTLVGTLPPAGVFICGTEKIQYGSITWNADAVSGTFNSCKRGWEGTTAAIHLENANIYFGDAFALNTQTAAAFTNAITTIPFSGLDRPGQIPETGVVMVENEWIWYGGVNYTDINHTAGNLLYCFRGYNGTTAAAHAGDTTALTLRFEHIFKHRESVAIYNYTASPLPMYYGFNPTITNAGTNALPILYGESVTIPLGCTNRIYAISGERDGGVVAIAEWR